MRRILAPLLSVALLPWAAGAGELDGSVWKMRPSGFKGALLFWQSDKLVFDKDRFTSTDCLPHGFSPSPYQARRENGRLVWNAAQKSGKSGQMEWSGTASGERMEGRFVWTRPDGKVKVIRWKARRIG